MIIAGGSWELLGRFNSIINYKPLDENAIKKVIILQRKPTGLSVG